MTHPENYQAVEFVEPGKAELVDHPWPTEPLGPTEVQGRVLVSLISAGTELAVYQGQFKDAQFPYPAGYAAVAEVTLVGPGTQVPGDLASAGVRVSHDIDAVLPEMDVVNLLRIQSERQGSNSFPTIREYSRLFGMNAERLARCKKDVLIMHPGPINRGVELTSDVADGPSSAILQQVTNGVAIRMAVMYLVAGAKGK